MLGTIGVTLLGIVLLRQVPEAPENLRVDKFAELDTNRDGQLSLPEFGVGRTTKYAAKWFERRDKNHDGLLCLAEFVPQSASAGSKEPEVIPSDDGLPPFESLD